MSEHSSEKTTRRQLLKRAAYLAPVIVTLPVAPSLAAAGSATPRPTNGMMGGMPGMMVGMPGMMGMR